MYSLEQSVFLNCVPMNSCKCYFSVCIFLFMMLFIVVIPFSFFLCEKCGLLRFTMLLPLVIRPISRVKFGFYFYCCLFNVFFVRALNDFVEGFNCFCV